MSEPLLSPEQIARALTEVPGWEKRDSSITKTFVFKNFVGAMGFVTQVAILAEKAWHHPDIDIRWNRVTVTLSTHDAGGLTQKDFDLASQLQAL
ncbi:4a-hydroxytetrahydrobiopterin dehydratase [Oscillatoria laete-virens NRMC-F 0139]|nr:4a-hydroxytetrahydrobiopterin dehydratase [Oscillatoria laete-virens]MDL5053646.1 4a-hydroxytetrahydrobiopterin dehydratase [Oscillatoria laete-virens NRMC-F 0139]